TGLGDESRSVRRGGSVALQVSPPAAGAHHASGHPRDEGPTNGAHALREVLRMMARNAPVLSLVVATVALSAAACSATPRTRAPLQMVKIETSPGGGSSDTRPLALHSDIEA